MKKTSLRNIFTCLVLFFPCFALATSDSELMCPGEWVALTNRMSDGEREFGLGNLRSAQKHFRIIVDKGYPLLAAQAAYRLAEIEEQELAAIPRLSVALRSRESAFLDIKTLLEAVQSTRNAFMRVMAFSNAFWNRRAAYRIITLMDDALRDIHFQLNFPNPLIVPSPFSVIFTHIVYDRALDEQLFALEQEQRLIETTLLQHLKLAKSDPPLLEGLIQRNQSGHSPSFAQLVHPPWAQIIPAKTVIRHQGSYFEIRADDKLKRLSRSEALAHLRKIIASDSQPVPFAFALALLADEKEHLSEQLLAKAILSENAVIQMAGLYAAEKLPSEALTKHLLTLWQTDINSPLKTSEPLFSSLQNILFRKRERLLLCLAAHFSLGRNLTRDLLASKILPDDEKAWLLQFRKDKTSSNQAIIFLNHQNPMVRARTLFAMRTWKTTRSPKPWRHQDT